MLFLRHCAAACCSTSRCCCCPVVDDHEELLQEQDEEAAAAAHSDAHKHEHRPLHFNICGESSRIFRDAADFQLPSTNLS